MLSEQSDSLNWAMTPFMSHITLLKLLTQTVNWAKKNIFIVNIICGLCTRASPGSWRGKKNEDLVYRTLPIVRGRNWRNFSGTGPLTACALLFSCDARLVHHKLRPPLKYSEEQMVLKHDCSPSHTCHAELRWAQCATQAHTHTYTHTHSHRYKHKHWVMPISSHTVCPRYCREFWQ